MKDYGWDKPKTHAHNYLLKELKESLSELGISLESKILDAGCGGGYVLGELYKSGYKNIWGFDSSISGIDVTKKNYPEIKDRVGLHDAYIKTLPDTLPDGGYDLVLSIEVIEHLHSPKTYLQNINYWLKPGGYLILTTPYHGYIKNLAIALINGFDSHFNPNWEGGHVKFFSKKTLFEKLNFTGFTPIKFSGSGRIPFVWKSMVVTAQSQN